MNFREYPNKTFAWTWAKRKFGAQWLAALGSIRDAMLERLNYGVQARFPAKAPYDALTLIGQERQLPRVAGEAQDVYVARLIAAWETWAWAGTGHGILKALEVIGFPNAWLVTQTGKQVTLDTDGNVVQTALNSGSWRFDSNTAFWSRFELILSIPDLPSDWASKEALIQSAIRQWRAGQDTCVQIQIITAGRLVGFPQTLLGDDPDRVLGGGVVTNWSP